MNSHKSNDILSNAHHSIPKEKCEQTQNNHRIRAIKSKINGLKMVQITEPEQRHIDISNDTSKPDYKNASSSSPKESWMNSANSTEKHRRRLRHDYICYSRMSNIQTLTAICAAILVLGTWSNSVSASTLIITTIAPSTIRNNMVEETSTDDLSKILKHHVEHNGVSNVLDNHKAPGSEYFND